MKSIIVGNTHGLAQGKTAIATGLTKADTCRIGTDWVNASTLPHGAAVEAVNHFGRHTTERGDVLSARSIDGPAVEVKVLDIQVADPDQLTEADFQALGYRDRADYTADWGEVLGGRIWLMKVQRL